MRRRCRTSADGSAMLLLLLLLLLLLAKRTVQSRFEANRLFLSPLGLLSRLQSSSAVYSYTGATRGACHHGMHMQVMAIRMLLACFKMLGLGAIFRVGADATTISTVNCTHVVQPVP